jgi:transposase
MNHVIAFDVSMGKSFMVIYTPFKQCVFEGEINHKRLDLDKVKEKVDQLIEGYGVPPEIVFESTGVYSKPLERFMNENNYSYCLLNPLEAKIQCDSLRIHKTDRSDAHQLALTHFTSSRR